MKNPCRSCGGLWRNKPKSNCTYEKHSNYYQRNWIEKHRIFVELACFYKEVMGCAKCGLHDSKLLDFHHKIPVRQHHVACSSFAMFQRFVRDCVILCANCHRLETPNFGRHE